MDVPRTHRSPLQWAGEPHEIAPSPEGTGHRLIFGFAADDHQRVHRQPGGLRHHDVSWIAVVARVPRVTVGHRDVSARSAVHTHLRAAQRLGLRQGIGDQSINHFTRSKEHLNRSQKLNKKEAIPFPSTSFPPLPLEVGPLPRLPLGDLGERSRSSEHRVFNDSVRGARAD